MKERHRIGTVQAIAMYIVAFLLDLVGLILGFVGLNFITSVLAFIVFAVWFGLNGASYIRNPKRILKQVAVMVFGALPLIGALPIEQVIGVWMNIREIRKEDKQFNAQQRAAFAQQNNEEEARIQRAMWMREARGFNDETGYNEAA